MKILRTRVRYVPCVVVMSKRTGVSKKAYFNIFDPLYFNEQDRGLVFDDAEAWFFLDETDESSKEDVAKLFSQLRERMGANPDEDLEILETYVEKQTSHVMIEKVVF